MKIAAFLFVFIATCVTLVSCSKKEIKKDCEMAECACEEFCHCTPDCACKCNAKDPS
jgi:hypothetical protein